MSQITDWIFATLAAVLPAFGTAPAGVYNGYIEAEYIYASASGAGRIVTVGASEGDTVRQGQQLLQLEDTEQAASLRAAVAGVAVAQANLDDLKTGSRAEEIEVIRASLHQAQADQSLARLTLERSDRLLARGYVPSSEVDNDRAALQSADARLEQLTAQLKVAELPARDAQRVAAEAALDKARAEADAARSDVDDRLVAAPITGTVDKVYYDPGEVVAAGAPILSLFDPDRLKAILFIPEPERASVGLGDTLAVTCDGCPPNVRATITRLAASPQYTPPIIYSREERARLVYRAEAVLTAGTGLLPGQPVALRRQP